MKLLFRKITNILGIFSFLLISFFLSSCNDLPTTVGFAVDTLLIEPITSDIDTIITDSYTTMNRLQATMNSGMQFIGKHKNYTAISFLRYEPKDTNTFSITEDKILSATLNLHPNRYTFGDTVDNTQSFDIFEIDKAFSNNTTWDTIYPGGGNSTDFWSNNKVGAYEGKLTLKDTMPKFEVAISPTILAKWFAFAKTKDTVSPYYLSSYALALVPNSKSKVINRFFSESGTTEGTRNPYIKVVYKKANGDTATSILSAFVKTFYIDGPAPEADKLTIQGGIATRALLKFDLSKIPANSIIMRSQLEIFQDKSKTELGNFAEDKKLFATYNGSEYSKVLESTYQAVPDTGANTDRYIFPHITSAIEKWVQNSGGKGELYLFAEREAVVNNEIFFLDKQVFYGVKASDPKKRPKLTVFYAKRPKI